MARRKAHPKHENHERWLVSYADFITLLFAFFVVMFASSQTDKGRAQRVSDSVNEALENGGIAAAVHQVLGGTVNDVGKGNAQMKGPGGAEHTPKEPVELVELAPSMQFLNKALEKEIEDGKIEVRIESRGLVVSLRQAAFFPSGEDAIDPATFSSIDHIAKVVKQLPNPVRLEGHTDSVPIHTSRFRSNWELSAARSIVMMQLLHDRFEVPSERMAIAGFADTAPVTQNDTAEGRAQNRRVDIVILNKVAARAEPATAEPKKKPAKSH